MRTTFLVLFALLTVACRSGSDDPPPASPPPPPPPPPADAEVGLDARPSNLTCLASDRPLGDVDIALEHDFENLDIIAPLGMVQTPGDDSRWFAFERGGRVRVFSSDPTTSSFMLDFIDVSAITSLNTAGEGGLLGMAFHPDYPSDRSVFLSWTEGSPMVSVIARFTVNADGQTIDPSSRQDIIRLEQDFNNHNGGNIAFGPDGYLYIGFGDGGSGGDPNSRAQDTTNLLGAMLRLDIDAGSPYAIPPDNPFAGNPSCPANHTSITDCPEIYAWGLRNPWRWSFDTATGDLWLGDVGQGAWEEIDVIERGGNYGWDCREGAHDHVSPAASCAGAAGLIDPVHEYSHSQGISVTGGFVYRGTAIPQLQGDYLFADFGSGRLWRLVDDGAGGLTDELLLETGLTIASFAQSNAGELYLIAFGDRRINRIVAGAGAPSPDPIPERLSETGCVLDSDASQPAEGLVPYAVTAPFWSDGADKQRWLAIPDGTTIDVDADGDFILPARSVVMKQFRIAGQLIETRLLMRHPDGVWRGYSYEWDAALGDGVLVTGGKIENVSGQPWLYPSSAQCNACHTAAAGHSLGLESLQLNRNLTYPSTGLTANQLSTLEGVAMVNHSFGDPDTLASLVDPLNTTASLDDRARAYLHTNCAQCHRPGGPTPSDMDLRYETSLNLTGACDLPPQSGNLGLGAAARLIAPGDAARSVLVARMNRRDASGMPPLASNVVDSAGVNMLTSWINSLGSCN